MGILDLYAENAYSYKKLHLKESDFNAGGITAIIGKSVKEETANGSGKSSIIKLIYYGVTGKELNKEPISEISNRVLGRGHFLQIILKDKNNILKIQRFVDFRPNKDSLIQAKDGSKAKLSGTRFWIDGEPFADKEANGEPMSDTKTKQAIIDRLGISPELFLASVLTAQDSDSNFLTATDIKKKEIISELLNLQVYEEAYNEVKEEIDAKDKQVSNMESRIEEILREEEMKTNDLRTLTTKEVEFNRNKEIKVSELQSRYVSFERDFSTLSKRKPKVENVDELVSTLKAKESKLKELMSSSGNIKSGKTDAIDLKIREVEGSIRAIGAKIGNADGQLSAIKKSFNQAHYDSLHEKLKVETIPGYNLSSELEVDLLSNAQKQLEIKVNTLKKTEGELNFKIIQLKKEIDKINDSTECPTCNRPWDKTHEHEKQTKVTEILGTVNSYSTELIGCQSELNSAKQDLDFNAKLISFTKLCKEINDLSSIKEKISSLEELKNLLTKSNSEQIEILRSLTTQKDEILKDLRSELEAQQKAMNELSIEVNALKELISSEKINAERLAQWERNCTDLRERMREIVQDVTKARNESNPYADMIITVKDRLIELDNRKIDVNKKLTEYTEELKYLNFWKNAFGPTGIRSFISDEVVVQLNEVSRDYLNDIYNGAISVVFESESVSQKGAVSNKISTKFFLNGKESPFGLLSGGEKQRIAVVVDLALSDIAEMRSGSRFNVKFLDEPFDGIDSNGQLKCLGLFSKIAKRKKGFFIVTHDSNFQALCQNVIYVLKDNEISSVVNKKEFDAA